MNRTALKRIAEDSFRASQRTHIAPGRPTAVSPKPKFSKRRKIMNGKTLALCLAAVAGLAGCAAPTPMFDQGFGDAVRQARALQTLNPDAGRNPEPVAGLDGIAAKEAIGRYQDSLKTPPPVMNVINIGGSLGGN